MKGDVFVYTIIHAALLALVLSLIFSLSGCKCPEYVAGTDTEKVIEIHHHDTTIVTEADSASVMALLRCDSAYNVVVEELTAKNGERLSTGTKTAKNGNALQLIVDCKEDSLAQIIQWQDSVIRSKTTQTIVKEVKYVPNYYKNCTRGFWFLLVILILIVGWKAVKIYFKIQSGGVL